MKAVVLLSLFTISAYAAPATQRDQESSTSSACPVMSCSQVMHNYKDQLLVCMKSLGLGALGGAALAGFETELVNPLVSYALAGYSDHLVIATEVGIMGAATYMAYQSQDSETRQELTEKKRLLGLIAGLVAWYQFHG